MRKLLALIGLLTFLMPALGLAVSLDTSSIYLDVDTAQGLETCTNSNDPGYEVNLYANADGSLITGMSSCQDIFGLAPLYFIVNQVAYPGVNSGFDITEPLAWTVPPPGTYTITENTSNSLDCQVDLTTCEGSADFVDEFSFTISLTSPAAPSGLFTAPSALNFFASTSPYSAEVFDSFYPVAFPVVGLAIGALLVLLVLASLNKGAHTALGGRRSPPLGRWYYKSGRYSKKPF